MIDVVKASQPNSERRITERNIKLAMSRKHKNNNQAANDLVFRKIPIAVDNYANQRKVNEIVLEHGGYRYEKVPSLGGKYVSQMLIRIATDTPAEMNGHLDAFHQWAVKTTLL